MNSLNNNTTWMNNCSWYLYRAVKDGEASSTEIPGYVRVQEPKNFESGLYLIVSEASNGSFSVLYPSLSTSSTRDQIVLVTPDVSAVIDITFIGIGEGTTSVRIENVRYNVTVTNYYETSATVEMDSSNLGVRSEDLSTGVDASSLDTAIAIYDIVDDDIVVSGLAPGKTQLIVGATRYIITVTGMLADIKLDLEGAPSASFAIAGDYTDADTTALEPSVVTVEISLTSGAMSRGTASLLSDNHYTFTADDKGGFTATGTTDGGTKVWLSPAGQGVGFPFSMFETTVDLAEGTSSDLFTIYDGSRYLYFRNGVFDRVGTLSGYEVYTSFALFRPISDDGNSAHSVSKILGYERVTGADEITNGEYLVVDIENGIYYLLHPSTSTSNKVDQVATVTEGASSLFIFTAVGPGETSLRLGNTRYAITVEDSADPESMHVTVTFELAGGEVTPTMAEVEPSRAIGALPTPVRNGYTFGGWFDADGNQVTSETIIKAEVTLIARWTEQSQKGGGTGGEDNLTGGTRNGSSDTGSDTGSGVGADNVIEFSHLSYTGDIRT
ncbi:MAG: InlB B-repeat-containing protein [Atopobiaceae bacterium]